MYLDIKTKKPRVQDLKYNNRVWKFVDVEDMDEADELPKLVFVRTSSDLWGIPDEITEYPKSGKYTDSELVTIIQKDMANEINKSRKVISVTYDASCRGLSLRTLVAHLYNPKNSLVQSEMRENPNLLKGFNTSVSRKRTAPDTFDRIKVNIRKMF